MKHPFLGVCLIVSHFILACGCMSGRRSGFRDAENPARQLAASDVTCLKFTASAGRKDYPTISVGRSETLFCLTNTEAIAEFVSRLRSIPDGEAIVLSCGDLTRIEVVGKRGRVLANVSIMWDGITVMIDNRKHSFAGRSRSFALYGFGVIEQHASFYLGDVLEGKRPAPPVEILQREIFTKIFPFTPVVQPTPGLVPITNKTDTAAP